MRRSPEAIKLTLERKLKIGMASPFDLIGLRIAGAAVEGEGSERNISLYLEGAGDLDLWLVAWRDEEQNGPGTLYLHTADGRGGTALIWTDTNEKA